MFIQFRFILCLCWKHVRVLDFLFSQFLFCFFLGQGFQVCMYAHTYYMGTHTRSMCTHTIRMHTHTLCKCTHTFAQVFLVLLFSYFHSYCFSLCFIYLLQPLFNLVYLCLSLYLSVLFCFVLFYLFEVCYGLRWF